MIAVRVLITCICYLVQAACTCTSVAEEWCFSLLLMSFQRHVVGHCGKYGPGLEGPLAWSRRAFLMFSGYGILSAVITWSFLFGTAGYALLLFMFEKEHSMVLTKSTCQNRIGAFLQAGRDSRWSQTYFQIQHDTSSAGVNCHTPFPE